jgi:hypothetical protein
MFVKIAAYHIHMSSGARRTVCLCWDRRRRLRISNAATQLPFWHFAAYGLLHLVSVAKCKRGARSRDLRKNINTTSRHVVRKCVPMVVFCCARLTWERGKSNNSYVRCFSFFWKWVNPYQLITCHGQSALRLVSCWCTLAHFRDLCCGAVADTLSTNWRDPAQCNASSGAARRLLLILEFSASTLHDFASTWRSVAAASTCKSFLLETATYLYTLTQEVRSQQHTFPNFPCSFLISKQIPSRVSLSSFLYCITSSLSFLFIIYMSRGGKLTTKDLQTPRCRTDTPHDIFYSSNNKTRYFPSCTYLRF